MRIWFFGRLSDHFGDYVDLEIAPACSIAGLRDELSIRFPNAGEMLRSPSVRACVGDVIVAEDFIVEPGQAVEFWPPVSGG